jgi:preprotein translocase subunit YajC
MNPYITVLVYAGIIALFYFFFIRPQRKQKKELEEMRSNLKKGDKIVTIGGIYAEVLNVEKDNLVISTRPNDVKFTIAKWAVRSLIQE